MFFFLQNANQHCSRGELLVDASELDVIQLPEAKPVYHISDVWKFIPDLWKKGLALGHSVLYFHLI